MKKVNEYNELPMLKNISKKNIHKVPEGYFNTLPNVIQSRVIQDKQKAWHAAYLIPSFKYVLPVMAMVAIGWYFGTKRNVSNVDKNMDSLLVTVSDDDLIQYLQNTDVTAEEVIEFIGETQSGEDFIEEGHFIFDELNGIKDEKILEDLYNEYDISG